MRDYILRNRDSFAGLRMPDERPSTSMIYDVLTPEEKAQVDLVFTAVAALGVVALPGAMLPTILGGVFGGTIDLAGQLFDDEQGVDFLGVASAATESATVSGLGAGLGRFLQLNTMVAVLGVSDEAAAIASRLPYDLVGDITVSLASDPTLWDGSSGDDFWRNIGASMLAEVVADMILGGSLDALSSVAGKQLDDLGLWIARTLGDSDLQLAYARAGIDGQVHTNVDTDAPIIRADLGDADTGGGRVGTQPDNLSFTTDSNSQQSSTTINSYAAGIIPNGVGVSPNQAARISEIAQRHGIHIGITGYSGDMEERQLIRQLATIRALEIAGDNSILRDYLTIDLADTVNPAVEIKKVLQEYVGINAARQVEWGRIQRQVSDEFYDDFGILLSPPQVKWSTGTADVDFYVPPNEWWNIQPSERLKIREDLATVFEVDLDDVDSYTDILLIDTPEQYESWLEPAPLRSDGWRPTEPPPGMLLFDPNSSIRRPTDTENILDTLFPDLYS